MPYPLPACRGKDSPTGPNIWWLSGDIAAANCVAAYRAKGAASYAASKINLANPGTYDAADGLAYPSWNTATGWSFVSASSQYIDGPPQNVITGPGTIVCRFANYTNGSLMGAGGGGANMAINPAGVNYMNGGGAGVTVTPGLNAGNLCIAGINGYRNGISETAALPGTTSTTRAMCIGAVRAGPSPAGFYWGDIIAVAMYNRTLTPTQVAAVVAAMAAL
jgi:hypothetical protein